MGTYTLRAVRVGTLPVPGWEAFFGQNDESFYDLGFYVWLVTDGTRHGLIDTGLPGDPGDRAALFEACRAVDPRCEFVAHRSMDDVFADLGLTPDAIDFVVLTQPITYHSGGLEPRWFPRAEVYIPRAGIEEFLVNPPGHPPAAFYFTPASWMFLRDLAIEGRLRVTDGPVEVVPGVVFETTGGHHPGSAGVRVPTADGVVGLLETAFLQRNIDEVLPIGLAEDAATCREVIARYVRECDRVIAIHDPGNTELFPATGQP